MKKEDDEIKRQQIAPGIFMEKYQEKIKDQLIYIIKIELQLFKILDFNIDFTGSANVRLNGTSGLTKNTIVQPFTKTEVARLILDKKWNLKTKFKFSMRLPAIETQQKHLESPRKILSELITKRKENAIIGAAKIDMFLKAGKEEFLDIEFLPHDFNIGLDESGIIYKYECIIQWRTAKDIFKIEKDDKKTSDLVIFPTSIFPNRIKTGKLEDFWLISALAALTEKPNFLKRMINSKSGELSTIYTVKLFEMGKQKNIIIDEYFPCYPLGGLIFSRFDDNQLWVCILEKAFAKLYGGYMRLALGTVKNALVNLTNCPTFSFDLNDETSPLILRSIKYFGLIKEWIAKKFIIVATAGNHSQKLNVSQNVSEHGYSIVNYLEIDHSIFPIPKNEKAISKIVKLRNPWGLFEWAGDWSHNSVFWTDQVKHYYDEYLIDESDSFWIPIENLIENFGNLTVCMSQGWNCFQSKGLFVKCNDTSQEGVIYFASKDYFAIQIDRPTNIVLGIHQEDERNAGVFETRPNIDIGLIVLQYSEGTYKYIKHIDSEFSREVFLELSLQVGTYYIVPKSIGVFLGVDQKNKVTSFDPDGKLEKSIITSIFEKYDQFDRGHIEKVDFDEIMANFEAYFDESKISSPISNARKSLNSLEYITQKEFERVFKSIFSGLKSKDLFVFLKKFGYNNSLVCDSLRSFSFTLHSDRELSVSVKDALSENLESISFKMLLKHSGKVIEQKKNQGNQSEIADVECYYYFNELNN